jgi:1-acyl-sn-glycerol-3-phosphate acyltransferase
MDDWKLEPAHDHDLQGIERCRSYRREGGLISSTLRLMWWSLLRSGFGMWNGLRVIGREHLPAAPPFVLVANHTSHLDALLLQSVLPAKWRDHTFPIAAHDVFFEQLSVAAFASTVINALPVQRKGTGRHALAEMRQRMIEDPGILILFPEGTRSRTGDMGIFKPGIGMLVAGTPAPVVPCHIDGSYHALPPDRRLVRPRRITVRLGPAHNFAELPEERSGWQTCAERLEASVRELAEACAGK